MTQPCRSGPSWARRRILSSSREKAFCLGNLPASPHQPYKDNNSITTRRGRLGSGVPFTIPWIYIAPLSSKGPSPQSPGPRPQPGEAMGTPTSPPPWQSREPEAEASKRLHADLVVFRALLTSVGPSLGKSGLGPLGGGGQGAPGITGRSLCISGCRSRSCGWRSPAP